MKHRTWLHRLTGVRLKSLGCIATTSPVRTIQIPQMSCLAETTNPRRSSSLFATPTSRLWGSLSSIGKSRIPIYSCHNSWNMISCRAAIAWIKHPDLPDPWLSFKAFWCVSLIYKILQEIIRCISSTLTLPIFGTKNPRHHTRIATESFA